MAEVKNIKQHLGERNSDGSISVWWTYDVEGADEKNYKEDIISIYEVENGGILGIGETGELRLTVYVDIYTTSTLIPDQTDVNIIEDQLFASYTNDYSLPFDNNIEIVQKPIIDSTKTRFNPETKIYEEYIAGWSYSYTGEFYYYDMVNAQPDYEYDISVQTKNEYVSSGQEAISNITARFTLTNATGKIFSEDIEDRETYPVPIKTLPKFYWKDSREDIEEKEEIKSIITATKWNEARDIAKLAGEEILGDDVSSGDPITAETFNNLYTPLTKDSVISGQPITADIFMEIQNVINAWGENNE